MTKETYQVSTPVERETPSGKKTFWTNIGASWKGDNGWSIQLSALPINGKLFISTTPRKKKELVQKTLR